ncbi:MAG: type 1 glutamine amidotransferase domain-containing protein [Variovorax sp.]
MKKILAIATNSNAELAEGHRTGLWLSELTHFLEEMQVAGYRVDLASPLGGKIPLDAGSVSEKQMRDRANARFMGDRAMRSMLETSLSVSGVEAADYAAIYLSGGHGTMFDFRQSAALQQKLTEFHTAGKILAGVCHGVAGYIDAEDARGDLIVAGRRITGFSNIEDTLAGSKKYMPFLLEDELSMNGALYRKNLVPFTARVEVDGMLVTGQNPQSAKAVGREVVKLLKKQPTAAAKLPPLR